MQERQLINHLCLATLSPGLVWGPGTQLQDGPETHSLLFLDPCVRTEGPNLGVLL